MAKLLTVDEACQKLRLAKPTIYCMTSRRQIPHIKIGGRLLFDEAELDEWLKQFHVPASE